LDVERVRFVDQPLDVVLLVGPQREHSPLAAGGLDGPPPDEFLRSQRPVVPAEVRVEADVLGPDPLRQHLGDPDLHSRRSVRLELVDDRGQRELVVLVVLLQLYPVPPCAQF
jgi:hypothetical protein